MRLVTSSRRHSIFFFQAEDGIRDWSVTGVQTCALPIWRQRGDRGVGDAGAALPADPPRRSDRQRDAVRSEERRVGKGVNPGGRGICKTRITMKAMNQPMEPKIKLMNTTDYREYHCNNVL